MTVLLREAVGDRLRRARTAQSRTLRDVSRAARVSLGYLSEVERGRKEASSELLASICDALDLPLPELLVTVAGDLDETMLVPSGVDRAAEMVPGLIGAELTETELAQQQLADADARACAERLQPVLSQRISAPVRKPGGVVVAA
ncbi:helix-turn-helix domain-containing protein [Saccharopolyspora indica]|uniref:helix-turn-helix domain-containing protein n=1 Tax=Saccharopolyspora indica TaxID=1229659 RepID=UPI0022EB92C4|nr:helix-turn-helix transcriptional regulator [Saccharopolyspora indica]MDA3643682.1 helix-turn-helix transcriptional regulator [Saccharopolyspora indica]